MPLPAPSEQYSAQNEREARRLIEAELLALRSLIRNLDDVASASIANDGTLDIDTDRVAGCLLITSVSGKTALVGVSGTVHTTVVFAVAGTWSGTQGTAATINVYWNAGTSTYRLENKSGAAQVFFVTRFGTVTAK